MKLDPALGSRMVNWHQWIPMAASWLVSTIRDECYVFCVEISLILESICQERYPSSYTSQSSVVFPSSYNSGINRNQYHHYAFGMPHTVSITTTSRNVTSLEWCLCRRGISPKMIRNFRSVKCINGELYGDNGITLYYIMMILFFFQKTIIGIYHRSYLSSLFRDLSPYYNSAFHYPPE